MAKTKKIYYCQNCGAQHSQWMGQCSTCKKWNTIAEEVIDRSEKKQEWKESMSPFGQINHSINIIDVNLKKGHRIRTGNKELDNVLGGGIVPGSMILMGGEPGIGKSTLLLQLALSLQGFKTLYVSGEESANQIKMRADRIGIVNQECFLLTETNTQKIFKQIKEVQPDLLVIDSVQTLHSNYIESSAGSISQIRECANELMRFAKEMNTPVFIIGHITKDGAIAGPKILEHMVDVVLQFEGDRNHLYRILRAHKNRFGSTAEIGIYEMYGNGLREVSNPSEMLISKKDEDLSGSAIIATMEGTRSMMIEVQALVSTAVYGTPQRSATGFDVKRLNMLLAVLEKRAGFRLGVKDVFLNVTGGIKVDDPSIDLGVVVAILSSNEDVAISEKYCFAAEVGLSGEIRPVSRIEKRIQEADKLGFEMIFISKYNQTKEHSLAIRIVPISKISEVYFFLFKR
ncbi:MAG: DNA repair protein RadA [Flavobacteriales bacterium]